MKIPLLPETDLARIAPQPRDSKYDALEHFRISYPPYRYVVRKVLADIFNVSSGFLISASRVPLSAVEAAVRSECRSPEELEANLAVARALYEHAEQHGIGGRRADFLPFNVGAGSKVVFWHPMVLAVDGRPLVPFVDPRRTATLTELGRRFVFSMMHERIRAADPDFADAELGIFQLSAPSSGPRQPKLHMATGVQLFSYAELTEMVRETYEIWTEVYLQRAKTEPKRGGGGLFG